MALDNERARIFTVINGILPQKNSNKMKASKNYLTGCPLLALGKSIYYNDFLKCVNNV